MPSMRRLVLQQRAHGTGRRIPAQDKPAPCGALDLDAPVRCTESSRAGDQGRGRKAMVHLAVKGKHFG